MRLKLLLKCVDKYLTPNYNYPLSAAIYKMLKFGSPEFAEFLHDVGYVEKGKYYKLFCWALRLNRIKPQRDIFKLESPLATLIISSPLVDKFLKNVVLGAFNAQKLEIVYEGIRSTFEIQSIESLEEPVFAKNMKFKMLSPIVLSTRRSGNSKPYYYRFYDDINEINKILNNNLKNKYKLITKDDYKGDDILLQWDEQYIKKAKSAKQLTSLIKIKTNGKPEIFIKGNRLPFTLSGAPELMKIGYEAGFGSHNSLGFGLCEVLR